jgi:hypothetical protein
MYTRLSSCNYFYRYLKLRHELECYDPELVERPSIIVANKIDAVTDQGGGQWNALEGGGVEVEGDGTAVGVQGMLDRYSDTLARTVMERLKAENGDDGGGGGGGGGEEAPENGATSDVGNVGNVGAGVENSGGGDNKTSVAAVRFPTSIPTIAINAEQGGNVGDLVYMMRRMVDVVSKEAAEAKEAAEKERKPRLGWGAEKR